MGCLEEGMQNHDTKRVHSSCPASLVNESSISFEILSQLKIEYAFVFSVVHVIALIIVAVLFKILLVGRA